MKETHRGWTIEITTDHFGTSCWVTGPNGEEHKLFVASGQDIDSILVMARGFISRLERTAWQPS